MLGSGFATMGLLDTHAGELRIGEGNEATVPTLVAGAVMGAALGATILRNWPLSIIGAILGLISGIWLRDNLTWSYVQPPWVFLLILGLPALGGAIGTIAQRSKKKHEKTFESD